MRQSRYEKSTKFLFRAQESIPLGSQTFSKSRTQYPVGVSPLFMAKAKGSEIWDIDGNKYLDLVNSLASITLGYQNYEVDTSVRKQIKRGTIFSLPGILEAEVAELIVDAVPSAELVRFGKNGSDATSAAIRLARAYTGKEHVAFCGYHGWQDWYIGSTTLNKGVPKVISELSHKFMYNQIETLNKIFSEYEGNVAAVILEPMTSAYPENNFLFKVKEISRKNGAVLIFDETVTGFRFSKGGAQYEFGVTPDLTTLGKGMANGYPLSAVTGKREIMVEMESIFFSGTFGGELLSLAAAKSVLSLHNKFEVTKELAITGNKIAQHISEEIQQFGLNEILSVSGHPTWKFLNWSDSKHIDSKYVKTFFLQEMFLRGILVLGTNNVSWSYTDKQINRVKDAYSEVLEKIARNLESNTLITNLRADPIEPLFKIR
jgi:glutamate-1-semialdehyde 2,1-aminomutase